MLGLRGNQVTRPDRYSLAAVAFGRARSRPAQPTSRYTVDGGVQVTNCHRSTLPLKLPALANNGGGTKSIIHRPTRTPSGRRSVLVGVVASRGSPAKVFLCT